MYRRQIFGSISLFPTAEHKVFSNCAGSSCIQVCGIMFFSCAFVGMHVWPQSYMRIVKQCVIIMFCNHIILYKLKDISVICLLYVCAWNFCCKLILSDKIWIWTHLYILDILKTHVRTCLRFTLHDVSFRNWLDIFVSSRSAYVWADQHTGDWWYVGCGPGKKTFF